MNFVRNMESAQPIQCHIKAPIFVEVGPYKSESRSGCCIIDITFPNLFYVEVNFYCASFTLILSTFIPSRDSRLSMLMHLLFVIDWRDSVQKLLHSFLINSSQMQRFAVR